MGTLEVDDLREDLLDGEGDRDLAALGESDRCTSDPGVEARELALLKGSDLARILFRLRAMAVNINAGYLQSTTYIDLEDSGHLRGGRVWVAQSLLAVMVVQSQC